MTQREYPPHYYRWDGFEQVELEKRIERLCEENARLRLENNRLSRRVKLLERRKK